MRGRSASAQLRAGPDRCLLVQTPMQVRRPCERSDYAVLFQTQVVRLLRVGREGHHSYTAFDSPPPSSPD